MTSPPELPSDLERGLQALAVKKPLYDLYWQYYEGDHPQIYTNKKLKEIFRDLDVHFFENWCALVVGATVDRIQLTGVQTQVLKKRAGERMAHLWRELGLDAEADEIHIGALVVGEAYLIAWRDGDGVIDAYANDARNVHVFYEAARPRMKYMAIKRWYDEFENRVRVTLYYRDRFEYYRARFTGPDVGLSAKAFDLDETATSIAGVAPNPFGRFRYFIFGLHGGCSLI